MSVTSRASALAEDVDLTAARARLVTVLFGDRLGLALFLGSLCALFVFTRVGIFITDTVTTANAFVALTEGRLAVTEPVYGNSLDTPGMIEVDGRYYGRNYGQLVASLPAYVLLRGVDAVSELRIALAGLWSLGLLGLSVVLGRVYDRREAFALGGSVAATGLFLANVAVATPLPDGLLPVLAMQLTSILAGALLAVVVYRLLRFLTTPRIGLVGGVLVIFATPVGFWAPIPKRHVVTTLLAFLAFLAFARSRSRTDPRRHLFHAAAYATAGLLAWVHAPEALVLFVTLVVADLVSAPLQRFRAVPLIAGTFLLALLPFLITNFLITGNPIVSPRVWGGLGVEVGGDAAGVEAGGDSAGNLAGGEAEAGLGSSITPLLIDGILSPVLAFAERLKLGLETVWYRTGQVTRTFVRSGYVIDDDVAVDQAVNLSMLESAPILGALVSVVARGIDSRPRLRSLRKRLRQPGGATAFALGLYAVLFSLLYLPELPVHAQVTVRYLLPVYIIGVVGLVWCPPLRSALQRHVRTFAWALVAGVLIGGQVLIAAFAGLDLALGEAFQFYALLGLALAAAIAIVSLLTVFTDRTDRLFAAAVGVTGSTVSVFTLLIVTAFASSIGLYPIGGEQLLPIVRVLGDLLTPL